MDLLRRLYRRGPSGPADARHAVEALLGGGTVESFLDYANRTSPPGLPSSSSRQSSQPEPPGESADNSEGEEGETEPEAPNPLVSELHVALTSDDSRQVRAVVKLLARDTKEASPDDRSEELGTAQAYHPLAAWLLQQRDRQGVRSFVRAVLQLVSKEDQASLYYAAESALAAIADAAHQKDRREVVLSMAGEIMDVVSRRLTSGVHLRDDDLLLDDDDLEDANYVEDFAAEPGEPHQLTSIAEAVLMLLNSRAPAHQWFLYPGWNPGTLVFVLERVFGLYRDDHEIEHDKLNVLIEKMISLLHGEHNLRAHVAGNAACALSQLCRTKGGMARVLTNDKADSMAEAISTLLAAENLPPNNYTSRIVTKWVGNLAEAEEGAPWLFSRELQVKTEIFSSLVHLLTSSDFQTATEASHALAQLLLYSEPDTVDGDAQRGFIYNLEASKTLASALASLMQAGGDPIDNEGPLQSEHSERYLRGYAAAEEACVVVAEMIYDNEGSDLLLDGARTLVQAVYSLLSSRDPDCAIAGANVLTRMADLSNKWGEFLEPTADAVSALTALLVHQSAHRHALPALAKVIGVKGWLPALLEHEQFEVLLAWLVSELDLADEQAGSAPASTSIGPTDAEASWAAGTLATIAVGSAEGAKALLDGPHGDEIIARLLTLLRRRDTRHAAAAALAPLQAASQSVREQLLSVVEGRGDGVALALLEGGGVDAAVFDEELKKLELAEKRSWLSTRLQHLHHPQISTSLTHGLMGPVELECHRDQLIQHMCEQHSKGSGLAGDLKSGVTIRFEGESGQGAAVRREWFMLMARELLNPDANLFVSRNSGQSYQPAPAASVSCDDPEQYMEVAGRVVGLALLHAVPLDCRFTSGFLRQLLEQEPLLEDMEEMDPEMYKHKIRFLLDTPYQEELELDFTDILDDTGVLMRGPEVELVPGGLCMMVEESNKHEYVQAVVQWRLSGSIVDKVIAFKRGLHAVVPSDLLSRMAAFVSPKEFSSMIAGLQDIDLEDWKANTRYEGESMSSPENTQVKWFWEMVDDFSHEERRALLQFATASPNVPVGGFARLQSATGTLHPFTLSELTGRAATNTLPRAAACFNTLYLPAFDSPKQMRERVKVADYAALFLSPFP